MLAIVNKELKTYFTSFTGYIFLAGFVFLMALFFYIYNISGMSASYMNTLANQETLIIFSVLIPILTMQLFSDEVKQHTDLLLYTSPISITQIVVGKYIGAFCLFLIGMTVTSVFPIIINHFTEIAVAETIGVYVGFILLGACFIGLGLFVSCLTNNTIVAAVSSFATIFLFYVLDGLALSMPTDRLSSMVFLGLLIVLIAFIVYDATKNIIAGIILVVPATIIGIVLYITNAMFYDALIFRVLSWFSVLRRFGTFGIGIIAISDVVYYLSFTIAFVYLTINTLEKRRWK